MLYCREETDSTSELRDSFSDSFSDESESEKLSRWDGCSSEEGLFEQDGFWYPNDRWGNPYFQYFETASPYGRVPLMDKVTLFSAQESCSNIICFFPIINFSGE